MVRVLIAPPFIQRLGLHQTGECWPTLPALYTFRSLFLPMPLVDTQLSIVAQRARHESNRVLNGLVVVQTF